MAEKFKVKVPLTVPKKAAKEFEKNFMLATRETGRLMLFAGDQKVEHMNDDFFGEGIPLDDADPEHLFRIADKAQIGVFATQLGLISSYGMDYKNVPYIVKLNSKSSVVPTEQMDPHSGLWTTVEQVVQFKKETGLKILGIGYTAYIGSEFEHKQLKQAAQLVYEAHKHGLITVFWMYPRGKAVKDEKSPHLIAGAAGVAGCLGTDFAKVNYPKKEGMPSKEVFKEAILAAGRTRVVCAGGSSMDVRKFLETLNDQLEAGAMGNATGRNIHQRPLDEAVRAANATFALTVNRISVDEAMAIYEGRKTLEIKKAKAGKKK